MSNQSLLVLGIDLEGMNQDLVNSGLNLQIDRVIEIGAVMWDCHSKQPVKILSELINEHDRLPISEEIEELTGINESNLKRWGLKGDDIKKILEELAALMEKADYLMAHNAHAYDIPMLEALFKRQGIPMPQKTWIDTLTDIEFPKKMNFKAMPFLEHAHGFINPFPHRAVTDVLSMLKIASNYSIARMGKLARSPRVTIIAKLNPPNWKDQSQVDEFNRIKNKVSRARFRWDPSDKTWSKEVHQVLLEEGKIQFDFDWYQAN